MLKNIKSILLAIILFTLLSPKWVLYPIAWFAPFAMLVATDGLKAKTAFLTTWAILFISGLVSNYKVMPFPPAILILMMIVISLLQVLPYALYRLALNHYSNWYA